jgi:hypothetical protein
MLIKDIIISVSFVFRIENEAKYFVLISIDLDWTIDERAGDHVTKSIKQ